MSINIKVSIPLQKTYDESFINLDENNIDKIYSDLDSVELHNNLLITPPSKPTSSKKYVYKNICIDYVDNVSEPSKIVPNSDDFRYLIKENNEYIFSKTNPKKTKVYDNLYLESLVGSFFNLTDTLIAKELYTNNNNYKVYSLPFGGIDRNDSYFYFVDSDGKINILNNVDIDYAEGLLYVDTDEEINVVFIFCLCNLVPLKITAKGNIKIEEENSNYLKIANVSDKNYVSLEDFEDTVLMTTLKDILIRVPSISSDISVDAVKVVKDQYIFLSRNETVILRKEDSDTSKNVEYLSSNTNLVDSLATSDKPDSISINEERRNDSYFIEIINKENKNTYMKQTPILIKLFNSVDNYDE